MMLSCRCISCSDGRECLVNPFNENVTDKGYHYWGAVEERFISKLEVANI